jgi:hypothetical protein
MDAEICYQELNQEYLSSRGDSIALFGLVLTLARESSMDFVLGCLERCVVEKRLSWMERNAHRIRLSSNLVQDGCTLFYKTYLGLSIPQDGIILEATDDRLVTRWTNPCPTLEACRHYGLDTREICRKVYQRPVQEMLMKLDSRLRFERNYQSIRPYQPYCEEIISIVEKEAPLKKES